ncbi:I78 family peptidase inhibitor [Stenotrophomonas sp. YAU14D1_LEIMI4_1]|uniref:I78 family peptidase inhibitor n=1 Tax=Stenotrophomonas sp. YAU14D1_LEIMI4_1 TaxID=2072407 RepID=UPI000D5417FB|nr:I78 family peptidase inhibitor [Stenotrophomonas sp. YAU14D1_LEIMI4_1]AWH23706.1 Elastase inhibitor AFLEI Flags: Precursor [Stenotrophomonas sp. YAU14D1_LEIMI4_1]
MSFPIRARSLSALLLPAVLALTACQAPSMDEQDAATAHAQQAAEAAKAPADEAGKATEAPPAGTCDASQVQSLVGQPYTDAVGKQAQEDAGASQVRVLKPNDVATMEFLGDRLNVEVDAKDVVSGVRCG